MAPKIITVAHAARIAEVHPETVRRWCRQEKFDVTLKGEVYVIGEQSFQEFLSRRKLTPEETDGRRSPAKPRVKRPSKQERYTLADLWVEI